MATFLWRMGERTPTSVRVMVHSDVGGILSAVVNGTIYTGETLVAEYPGKVDITGVSGSFTASLQLDGVEQETAALSVIEVKDSYNVAWGSCVAWPKLESADALISRYNIDAFFMEGDMPYINTAYSDEFGSAADPAVDQSEANYLNQHKRFLQGYWMQKLTQNTSFFYAADDHEYFGNNWDNTRFWAFGQNSAPFITSFSNPPWDSSDADHTPPVDVNSATAGNLEVARTISRNAIRAYSKTNPDADSGNPDHLYWSWKLPNNAAEFFMLDCINYKSAQARRNAFASDGDGRNHADHLVTEANATMLGATQLAWFKAALLACTSTFKVITSTKKTMRMSVDNGDAWEKQASGTFEGYEYELDNILQFIQDNNITGVVWATGDKHYPHVMGMTPSSAYTLSTGNNFNHVDICASPIQLTTNGIGNVDEDGLIWGPHTNDGTTFDVATYSNFGLLEIQGHDYIDISICQLSGKKMQTWRFYAGENIFRDAGSIASVPSGGI